MIIIFLTREIPQVAQKLQKEITKFVCSDPALVGRHQQNHQNHHAAKPN